MKEILTEIATSTAQSIGTEFLAALVRSMREAMEVKLVFITVGMGEPPRRARSVASWQQSGPADAQEYDLEGTPCRFVYNGETLIISEGLYKRFSEDEKYEGYIGVPLRGVYNRVIGHFAVFSEKPIAKAEQGTAIVKLFATRAEAELLRLEHEREREALITSLARSNRRLSNRHEALRQSNEAKTMLLGMAAHDLRNPLAAILNRSELIQSLIAREDSASVGMAKALESCNIIISTTERMERLIASTLSRAKAETAAIVLDSQEFPVNKTIEVAIALNHAAAERKSIAINFENPEMIITIGDEDRIVEALDNLIRNAIKYSFPGQKVSVGARINPASLDVFVSDEGQGLTGEDCERAFQQFQRLSAKPTAGEPSTGLGLAIVKTIAEAHGGKATVLSAGKGMGATFTLSLPRKNA